MSTVSKTTPLEREPWRALPRSIAAAIEPELTTARDEILAAVAREVPDYAGPLEGPFGRNIRLGAEQALRQFAALIEDPDSGRAQSREVYIALGRGEQRAGRSLDALQAAYLVGARVAWRRFARAGLAAGTAPEVLCDLADAIFAYINELAADSVEGYAAAQQEAAGQLDRNRRLLVAALLAEPWDEQRVRVAAAQAGWQLPATVAALACDAGTLDQIARRMPMRTLAAIVDERGCLVIADPAGPGQRALIERACESVSAVLGPTGGLSRARQSWARALSGLEARWAGAMSAEGLLVVEERLTELALWEARDSLQELAERRLSPLADLPPRSRRRMIDTLLAFLDERGNAPAMARVLHVHPQTVRYRLRLLRDLFGDALDEPQARFELAAVLRLGQEPRSEPSSADAG